MSDIDDQYDDDDPAQEEELPPELAMDDTEALEAELDEAGAEEDEEQKAEEEEEKIPELLLTEDMAAENLSLLSRVGDGIAHAYIKLDLREKELTDVSLLNRFIHLRFVDLSRNNLKDISHLSALSHLLTLRVDNNLLPTAKLDQLPYLQFASFSKNKLQNAEGLSHPMLEHLCLSFNEIPSMAPLDPDRLGRLHTLELRGNRLETTAGIRLPNLKNLFLGGNILKRLEDLDQLVGLATLHLRDNQLESLTGFSASMQSLEYINMRGNNISSMEELKKVAVLPRLRALVVSENPLSEDDEYRFEVIVAVGNLVKLDKDEIAEEERQEAHELHRIKQAELQAKADEEAATVDQQMAESPED